MAPSNLSDAAYRQRVRAGLARGAFPSDMREARAAKAKLFEDAVDPYGRLQRDQREKRGKALARLWYLELNEERIRRSEGKPPREIRLRPFLERYAAKAREFYGDNAKPRPMAPEGAAPLEEGDRDSHSTG